MIKYTIGAVRALFRVFFRTPIETKEREQAYSSRKILLDYEKAAEDSKAQVVKLKARIQRLRVAIREEEARNPKGKRGFDWVRFDNNTLLLAMKDDLHQAEVDLLTHAANLESNETNAEMHTRRIARLTKSLEERVAEAKKDEAANKEAAEPVKQLTTSVESNHGVDYDPRNGDISLTSPPNGPSLRGLRERPSSMGSLVSA